MNASALQTSADVLQRQLQSGELTSVQLVEDCLSQISAHNREGMRLNALISIIPRSYAVEAAKSLDDERKRGKLRSPLHGIPIIIKDCIVTSRDLGMPTTVGSHIFARQKPIGNATVVQQLLDAGLIIIGKGNMTKEFLGLKSNNTPIGWSAVGGQTLSAHRRPDLAEKEQPTCGGSSSGPATGVAAGFAPIGLGTETCGSVVYPASCCGLYGMKLTPTSASTEGVFKLSETFDGLGIFGRTSTDLALLTEIVTKKEYKANAFGRGGLVALMEDLDWSDLSIGIVESTWGVSHAIDKWSRGDVREAYESVPCLLIKCGAKVKYPLDVPDGNSLKCGEDSLVTVAYYEFPKMVEEFISNFEGNPHLKSLDDIIRWNEEHPEALPSPYDTQTELIRSRDSTMRESRRRELCDELRRMVVEGTLGKLMDTHKIDVVLSPSDSTLVSYSACARWPIATVPLGRMKGNGQPFGLFVLAKENREDILLKFMKLFEGTFPKIPPPTEPFVSRV